MTSHGAKTAPLSPGRLIIVAALIAAAVFLALPASSTLATTGAQQAARSAGSWLDRPMMNWNKVRELPIPVSAVNYDLRTRCPNLIRQPETAYEREIMAAGWLLYGAVQYYSLTQVISALTDADSGCRPLGHQAFVYFGHSYAGTLSPVVMDSLTNGAITTIRILSDTEISAEFARYRETDQPCCPTRMSRVSYKIRDEADSPVASPVEIVTKTLCPDSGEENYSLGAARLFEEKWKLIEVKGVAVTTNNPYIRFERAARIYSGNSGCNQIAGVFEIDGKSITFKRAIITRMACLDSEAQQLETDFMKALEQSTRFELSDDTLRFYDCSLPLLVFEPHTVGVGRSRQ